MFSWINVLERDRSGFSRACPRQVRGSGQSIVNVLSSPVPCSNLARYQETEETPDTQERKPLLGRQPVSDCPHAALLLPPPGLSAGPDLTAVVWGLSRAHRALRMVAPSSGSLRLDRISSPMEAVLSQLFHEGLPPTGGPCVQTS